ncbi:MAG: single-stranded DNA-binding protein [Chitinophagales bacterium]|nr:single-stranded DNA-binding protein [Chitinophagales bacterium]
MTSLNRVMLIGRLGKEPEIQHFDSGVVRASFSLATSEVYINKDGQKIEQTEWHNIVMWRKLAEIAEKYLVKGKLVYIEGKLKTRSWDDKEGNKRYVTEIDASNMIMLGSQGNEGGGGGTRYQGGGGGQYNSPRTDNAMDSPPIEMPESDDLPF